MRQLIVISPDSVCPKCGKLFVLKYGTQFVLAFLECLLIFVFVVVYVLINNILAIILGIILVVLALIGYFMWLSNGKFELTESPLSKVLGKVIRTDADVKSFLSSLKIILVILVLVIAGIVLFIVFSK